MVLTREEKKSVLSMVMESHKGITLTEAKTNTNIREEMKLNLEFYNSLKEGFIKNGKSSLDEAAGLFGTMLSVLGNIKDFLTGTKVIKDFTEWVKGLVEKLSAKLGPKIDSLVPSKIQDLAKDGLNAVEKFVKWLYNTLSYKGIAKLFAMIRYRTLKPSDEQKKCMELAAKKAYKWILYTLVAAFMIKVIIVAWPILSASGAAAGAGTGTQLAGFSSTFAPIKAILLKVGGGSLWKGAFSAASAGIKAKDSKKVASDIKSIEKEAKDQELSGFGDAWNQCKIETK